MEMRTYSFRNAARSAQILPVMIPGSRGAQTDLFDFLLMYCSRIRGKQSFLLLGNLHHKSLMNSVKWFFVSFLRKVRTHPLQHARSYLTRHLCIAEWCCKGTDHYSRPELDICAHMPGLHDQLPAPFVFSSHSLILEHSVSAYVPLLIFSSAWTIFPSDCFKDQFTALIFIQFPSSGSGRAISWLRSR